MDESMEVWNKNVQLCLLQRRKEFCHCLSPALAPPPPPPPKPPTSTLLRPPSPPPLCLYLALSFFPLSHLSLSFSVSQSVSLCFSVCLSVCLCFCQSVSENRHWFLPWNLAFRNLTEDWTPKQSKSHTQSRKTVTQKWPDGTHIFLLYEHTIPSTTDHINTPYREQRSIWTHNTANSNVYEHYTANDRN